MQNNNSTSMTLEIQSAIAMYMFIPATAFAQVPNYNAGKIALKFPS